MQETLRQSKERINKILYSLPKETEEDRNKIYSWKSIRDDSEIKILTNFEKGNYSVKWCKECKIFTCHRGDNCQICKAKISGLGNPEIHAKTIKSQIENGTHNFLSEDYHKNSAMKRIENEGYDNFCKRMSVISKNNWKDPEYRENQHNILVERWQDPEQAEAMMRGIINFRNSENYIEILSKNTYKQWQDPEYREFMNCVLKENRENGLCGYQIKECKIHGFTLHNGNHCSLCEPEKCKIAKIIEVNSRCKEHPNCNLMIFDENKSKYICSDCYKENFEYKTIDSFSEKIFKEYNNAFIQLTYRIQDSQNWNGAKKLFENDLINKNVGWFVYFKFYILDNKNNIVPPLVVGKSGTKLAKFSNGKNKNCDSDVNFSTNIKDGYSRKFLYENNLEWCKTHILVIPINSEEEAYKLENKLQKEFNLFGS